MIGISKLYCGTVEASDALRYGRDAQAITVPGAERKPVVVWNVGRRCNLRCRHCYSHSRDEVYDGELSTAEGKHLLDGLAEFSAPVVLFSGGEPLLRADLFELIAHARTRGLRAVLSTNGTLITAEVAGRLRELGLAYVGVSLDGPAETNDRFRGVPGAFALALQGIAHCREAGLKVGLRFTMHRQNIDELPGIFALLRREAIPRVCFYHLVYAGRGSHLQAEDLSHVETRAALDTILEQTRALHDGGFPLEALTVDNHCDGPYLYLRLLREHPARAAQAMALLRRNGGNSAGIGIGCVSWDGSVYPDQFWRSHPLGNVRERPFGDIWTDMAHPLLRVLKARKPSLTGRCAGCKWLDICNGNLRARAEAVTGDPWAPDPACYLTDEEIA